jgi:hypothetical protein
LEDASVEMMPKLISSAARTGEAVSATATDAAMSARSMLLTPSLFVSLSLSAHRE